MRIWSRSLTVQFIGLMLLALAVSQVVSAVVFWGERGDALQKAAKSEFISRCASIAKVLESTPKTLHDDILAANGTTYSRFWVTPGEPSDASSWRREAFEVLARPLPSFASLGSPPHLALAPSPSPPSIATSANASTAPDWRDLPAKAWPLSRPAKFQYLDDGANDLIGMGLAVQLQDGAWLNTAFAKPNLNVFWTQQSALSLTITALLLCGIATFIARGITRPMRQMAAAAEALGRGEHVTLPETGPTDIRQTAEAFNRMQERLQRFVDDRTRMLAAIGHDLRTPITSLRLRAEFVADDETREKMLATIDELRAMSEASLAFAREESVAEPTRSVDLTALVGSLCEDLGDLGQDVTFEEGPRIPHRCRPDAFRRAVRNVVENAVRYGGAARVRIVERAKTVDLVVEDDGPGIPSDQMEQVFAPFFRMEGSRSRETGGIGLGLAIARTTVRSHGGDIALSNTDEGLRVTISLPKTEPDVRHAARRRLDPSVLGLPRQA